MTAAGAALRAFLGGVIDYAGMFPPARLDLDPAVDEYVRHLSEPEGFMLGRFVVRAGVLGDLLQRLPPPGRGGPFRLAVLAGGGTTDREALDLIRQEAAGIREIVERHPGLGVVETVETRLPRETMDAADAERTRDYVDDFRAVLAGAGLAGIATFFEIPPATRWRQSDRDAAVGLADAGETAPSPQPGFKLRCGGPETSDVPSAARVAHVIAQCRDRGVPLKCTAGLHQPLRRRMAGSGVTERHGFLNVFAAAVLAYARRIPEDAVEACILEEDSWSFRFEDDAFEWRGRGASASEVERARAVFAIAFGSCSFDEPRQGLRDLGLLG
ncbi:MAG: hypothetical protein LAO51_20170 [Acidobacteriia bacterium]|nr:hypothetical protein [Terriglobia bacterium]